jgi:hypothetical protein
LELRPLGVLNAGGAIEEGVESDSPRDRIGLNRIVPANQSAEKNADLVAWLDGVADPAVERYWRLLSLVNGRIPDEPAVPGCPSRGGG